MIHWRTLAGEKRKHYIMPQFRVCDKIGICMYLSKYKVLTVGVDHILVCRQKKAGVEKRISHILLLNLRDTYTSYRNERQQPDNHLSDRGRTDTGGCPHGERHGVA